MTSIVAIPGEFYAYYDADRTEVVGWGFMPAGSDAGYFGPAAVWQDGDDPECDLSDVDSPFWRSVQALLHDVSAECIVRWEEDGWKVERHG